MPDFAHPQRPACQTGYAAGNQLGGRHRFQRPGGRAWAQFRQAIEAGEQDRQFQISLNEQIVDLSGRGGQGFFQPGRDSGQSIRAQQAGHSLERMRLSHRLSLFALTAHRPDAVDILAMIGDKLAQQIQIFLGIAANPGQPASRIDASQPMQPLEQIRARRFRRRFNREF